MTYRILVTGSREWTAYFKMRETIRQIYKTYGEDTVLVHGFANGADISAARNAESFGMKTEGHRADWPKYGKGAGPVRNQEMVDLGAELALVFFVVGLPCWGTHDCLRRIEKAEIPVRKYFQKKLLPSNI